MVNGKTINTAIDEQALEKLAQTLATFSAASEALRKQIMTLFPARYGSDLWWEQSIDQSKKDIAEGRYTELKTAEDVKHFFNTL